MEQSTPRVQYQKNAWAAIFCIFGALAVILGAFGAHGLEDSISSDSLDAYKTGVLYHFLHVLAALIIVLNIKQSPDVFLLVACWSFLLGIILFSGSIYLLSTSEITGWQLSFLGPVTPVGGLLFIIAWLSMATHFFKKR